MKIFSTLTFICFLIIIGVCQVFACVCVADSPSSSITQVDAVFVGKITKTLKDKRKWQVDVDKLINGQVPKTITFYASMVGTSCENSDFKLDEIYVFFANKISSDEVGKSENGTIPKDEQEKIGSYEPYTCGWTATLNYWNSPNGPEVLKDYKDEKFLKLLKIKKH